MPHRDPAERKAYHRRYYERTKEKQSAANKAWRKANPEAVSAYRERRWGSPEAHLSRLVECRGSAARRSGVAFSITTGDLAPVAVCPVLGIPLKWGQSRNRKCSFDSPSIDRIVPALGYVPGNVRIISQRANLLKSDASLEEMRLILQDMERLKRTE